MPTTTDAPYRIIQNVDQIPAKGEMSASTPPWASPTYYIFQSTGSGGDYANLEAATSSCVTSILASNTKTYSFGGSTRTFISSRGAYSSSADIPLRTDPTHKWMYSGAGLEEAWVSGSDFRDSTGKMKSESGHYIVLDCNGAAVWGSTLVMWDEYSRDNQLIPEDKELGNPRSQNRQLWGNSVKNTAGNLTAPPGESE